jgi:hypothetical protein
MFSHVAITTPPRDTAPRFRGSETLVGGNQQVNPGCHSTATTVMFLAIVVAGRGGAIVAVLWACVHNKLRATELLQISRPRIYRQMPAYGLVGAPEIGLPRGSVRAIEATDCANARG